MKLVNYAIAVGSGLILSALLVGCGSSGGGSNNNNSCQNGQTSYNNTCYASCTDNYGQVGALVNNYCQSTNSANGNCQVCTQAGTGIQGIMVNVNGTQQCAQTVQANGGVCSGMWNGQMYQGQSTGAYGYGNQLGNTWGGGYGYAHAPILPLPS